jgi:hypothetical protein
MFCDSNGNICKISNDKEIEFYKHCPVDLKKFIPDFKFDFVLKEGIDNI